MTDPTSIRDQGDSWSDDEITQLCELSTPAHISGLNLGRSDSAVRSKAQEVGILLDP